MEDIVKAKDEAEADALRVNDPTIKSGLGFRYEIHPMPNAVLGKMN